MGSFAPKLRIVGLTPPPVLKGGVGPSTKNWVTWGRGTKFFARKGDKLEKGELIKKWEVATFFTTLQFNSITFTFSDLQSFDLAMQDFHPGSHQSLVLKPGIICAFLIYSGSLQKMLTALFNLVWNTQKSKCTIFFECQGKCFLVLKRFQKR